MAIHMPTEMWDRIDKALAIKGLTQADLARACKITPQAISQMRGGHHPGRKHWHGICAALGIRIEWMTSGDGDMWSASNESSRLTGVDPIPSTINVDRAQAENLSLRTQLDAARQANAMLAEQLSAALAENARLQQQFDRRPLPSLTRDEQQTRLRSGRAPTEPDPEPASEELRARIMTQVGFEEPGDQPARPPIPIVVTRRPTHKVTPP